MTPKQILKENAGALLSRVARTTKTIVTLYNNEEANLDTDDGKYSTVCEDHGYLVNHPTFTIAESHLSHPEEWCCVCSGQEEDI